MVLELSAARRQFRGSPRLSALAPGVFLPHGNGFFVSRQHAASAAEPDGFPRDRGSAVRGGSGCGGVPAGIARVVAGGFVSAAVPSGAGDGGAGLHATGRFAGGGDCEGEWRWRE